MSETSLMYIDRYKTKSEMLRGQNNTEVIYEAIVNFLHILGLEIIFYHIFIEIELSLTTLKLCETY